MSDVHVLGIGGSTRVGSSTEIVVRNVLDAARGLGASTTLLCGRDLVLPPYEPGMTLTAEARQLVEHFRGADAVVVASPGYHGSISGLVKNGLDYVEELRTDERVYFDGLPVGCVVAAYGWQAAVNTLASLRQIAHALRGWPTPLGIAVNTAQPDIIVDGALVDDAVVAATRVVAAQLVDFARARLLLAGAT